MNIGHQAHPLKKGKTSRVIQSTEKVPQLIVLNQVVMAHLHEVHVSDCRTRARTVMFSHTGYVSE